MSNVISGSNQQQLYPSKRLSGSREMPQDGLQSNQSFCGHSVEYSRTPQVLHTPQADSSCNTSSVSSSVAVVSGYPPLKQVVDTENLDGINSLLKPRAPEFHPPQQSFLKRDEPVSLPSLLKIIEEIESCLIEHWHRDLSEKEILLVKSFPDILFKVFIVLEQSEHVVEKDVLRGKSKLERAKDMVNGVLGDLDTTDQKRSIRSKFSQISPTRVDGRYRLTLGHSITGILLNLKKLQ